MRKYFISALIAILACVMVFAGCSSAEQKIQVILECEGEYVGAYTVSTFNNAVVPEQSKDGYRFLGWSVKEDWTEGVDSEDLLSENTGLIRYDDVKDYIEDGKDSITLYAIFGEIPENDLVIAWYDKETTSGLNEEYVEAFEENLYIYLDSQGYTTSDMSIVVRGYSGDVGTTCSAILKDGDVDIMIGWSSTSNLTGTGGMDESSILENTSKITIGSKARYAARLTDTDLCNFVYSWILAEYGTSGDTSNPVEPETPSETADLVIGWYAKTATTGLDADLMAQFETALNTYLTSINSTSTVLIREYSGDYSVAEVGTAVNSNGDVDILIGMGKNITSSGGIETLERIDDYYINSISRNIARLTDEELTVTVFEWMQTYEVRVIFNSAYTVSEVNISGAASVAVDSSITLTAVLTVNDGSVYNSNAITWTSSSESVATVSADGVVTGIAEGTVTITATAYGVSGTYTVDVTQDAVPVTVSSVTISNENSDSVKAGSTRTLTATVAMSDGVTEYSGDITWASSDESIATVTDGVVTTGVKSGTVTITAAADGVTSEPYTITVADLVVAWYNNDKSGLDDTTMAAFETALKTYLTAQNYDVDNMVISVRGYEGTVGVSCGLIMADGDIDIMVGWSTTSNLTGTGGMTESSILANTGNITIGSTSRYAARLADTELVNLVYSWIVDTYGPQVTAVKITGATSVTVDSFITLTATVTMSSGDYSGTITWSSSDESIATVTDGVVTGVKAGTVTITATAGGVTSEAYSVEVSESTSAATVESVTINNGYADSVKTDSTRTLTATVAMSDGSNYSGDITWASSDESIATVTDGVVTGVKAGTVTITATAEGVTSAAYTIMVADLIIGWYDLVDTSGLNDLIIYNFNLGINKYLTTNGYDTTTVLLRAYDGDVATSCAAIMADGDVDIMLGWGGNISSKGNMTEGTDYIEHVSDISMGGKSRYITRITDSTLVNAVFSWVQTDDGLSYLATPTYDTSVVIGWYAKTSTTGLDSTIMAGFETALNTYLAELGITDATVTIRSYSADYSVAEVGTAVNTDGDVDILLGMGSNITSTGKIETLELVDDYTMGEKSRNIARLTDDPLTNLIFEWLQTDEVRAIFAA